MKTNSEIRQEALSIMKGNWSSGVIVTLVFLVVVAACALMTSFAGSCLGSIGGGKTVAEAISEMLYIVVSILVFYPFAMSIIMLFLSFVQRGESLSVKGLMQAFKSPYYGKSIGLYLLIAIFTALWTLLLIVPGIIKSLSYALAPYILAENPELTANQAINKSMAMMKGYKMQLFLISLGYALLSLLSIVALGIPLLWLYPYYQVVMAKFYEEVKSEYQE